MKEIQFQVFQVSFKDQPLHIIKKLELITINLLIHHKTKNLFVKRMQIYITEVPQVLLKKHNLTPIMSPMSYVHMHFQALSLQFITAFQD